MGQLPPYKFTYDSTTLPSRDSYSVDHWGYPNGASNTTSIPTVVYNGVTYPGANRDPNAAYTKAGVLTRITYPTGGYSAFTYENHDYAKVKFDALTASRTAGGLRIKKIVDHDGRSTASDVIREFSYGLTSNPSLSSGVVLREPKFFHGRFYTEDSHTYPYTRNCGYLSRASSSQLPLATAQGSAVVYTDVTVSYGGSGTQGTSISKFTFSTGSGADGWPYTPMPESWNNGLLLEKAEYNAQSQPVAKTATTHATGTTYGQTINALIAAYDRNDLFQGALFTHNTYTETTGWTYPTSETVTHYNETGSASFTYPELHVLRALPAAQVRDGDEQRWYAAPDRVQVRA